MEFIHRLIQLKDLERGLQLVAVRGEEAGTPSPGFVEVALQKRTADSVLPAVGPQDKSVCQSRPLGHTGRHSEGALRGVRERAKHTRDVLQRAKLGAALCRPSVGLALEIQDDEAIACAKHLSQMVVAVDADLHHGPCPQDVQSRQLVRKTGADSRT